MCEDCPKEENKLVELRFVGGRDKEGMDRGPFHSFETGKIYTVIAKNATLSFWEPVDGEVTEQTEDVTPETLYTDKEVPAESPQIDEEVPPRASQGLTRAFNQPGPPSGDDFVLGMDDEALKHFITGNGGKVDGRWGRDKLIEEAKKLQ